MVFFAIQIQLYSKFEDNYYKSYEAAPDIVGVRVAMSGI